MLTPFEGGEFRVTDIIGYRKHPITGANLSPHHGLDLVGISSKSITALWPGEVTASTQIFNDAGGTWQWGNYVKVTSESGLSIFYCHMERRTVTAGQIVRVGDYLGVEGSTGQSTGSHLHIEARRGRQKSILPADPADECNIATIMGIPNERLLHNINKPGAPDPDKFKALVIEKADLTATEAAYLDAYKYKRALWQKLWEAMKDFPKRNGGSYGKDYATAVVRATGFEWQTVSYIWAGPEADSTWRKLWWQMT